jgi:hypothetical protein
MLRFRNAISGIIVLLAGLFSTSSFAQDLERGRFEVRASGGTNDAGRNREPNWGVGGAFGLSKFVAITAGYTRDSLPGFSILACPLYVLVKPAAAPFDCVLSDTHKTMHEIMGGVRFSAVNRSRFTPYAEASLGVVKQTSNEAGLRLTEFGFAPHAGIDVKLTRHFGVGADAAYVKANRFTGFYRVAGGVFFRF